MDEVKINDFKVTLKEMEKSTDASYINNPPKILTRDGHPYTLDLVSKKIYGSGLIGFFNRIMGIYEIEYNHLYVAKNENGKVVNSIPVETAKVSYLIKDEKLYNKPNIYFEFREYYGASFTKRMIYFDDLETYTECHKLLINEAMKK